MKKLLATAALLGLSALPATALDLDNMTEAERDAFRAEVRAYLLDNPSIIIEAYTLYEQQQQELAAANEINLVSDNAAAIFDDGHSWVGGNPEGDITLVEFMDYRCGYCRKAHTEVRQLLEADGNIRFIVKELPILGDDSVMASRFAIATKEVAGDEAYELAHDALMGYRGVYSPKGFARLADKLGLDGEAITAEMNSPTVNQIIGANHQLAAAMGINGTPTFVLEDQLLRGYVPLDGMQDLVAAVRAE